MAERYKLNEEDRDVLEAANRLLRMVTERGVVRPAQLVSVAKLLHVLWMLPQACENVSISVSISTRSEYQEINGSSCWEFSAQEGRLSLSTGGSEYDAAVGRDSYSTMEWSISPSEASEYNGVWDERWMIPEVRYYPERKLDIDLKSREYTVHVVDHENPWLEDSWGEEVS